MNPFDYSKIVLTEVQQAIFNKFMYDDQAYLLIEEYNLMYKTGLLKECIDGKSTWFDTPSGGICELSDKGKAYRTYLKKQYKVERTISFHRWANTIIAAVALLIAIASLILSIVK